METMRTIPWSVMELEKHENNSKFMEALNVHGKVICAENLRSGTQL